MNSPRKRHELPARASSELRSRSEADVGLDFPPEAFEQHDDVRPEVVKALQAKADLILGEEEWVVVEGHVGDR